MSTHDARLDGCPVFDADLLESAFAPTIDARLDAHLASCPRCRKARNRYLRTNDALSAALAIGAPERFRLLETRGLRREVRRRAAAGGSERSATGVRPVSRRVLAFAAVVIAMVAALSALFALRGPRVEWTPIGPGADLVFWSSDRAFMRSGEVRFDVARCDVEIVTPQGVVRASDALFTLSVKNQGELDVNLKQVGVVVAASVLAGVMWFVAPDGNETRVVAGETLVSPPPGASAAVALEKSPEMSVESGSLMASSAEAARRSVPVSATENAVLSVLPALIGTVVDDATDKPIAGAEVACGRRDEAKAYLARATSDALGHFTAPFEVVASAELDGYTSDHRAALSLRVRHADYATSYEAPWDVRGEEGPKATANGQMDAGVVRLSRGTSIAGRVTTQDGAGVADAKLFVFDDGVDGGNFLDAPARSIGVTDAAGIIQVPERLARALHGNWVLCASSSSGMGWTPLPIVAGRERVDDITIVIGPAFTFEVEARDEQGRPIEGVGVQINPCFSPFSSRNGYVPSSYVATLAEPVRTLFSATTDAVGLVRFPALPLVPATPGATAAILSGYNGFDVVAEHPLFARAFSLLKRGNDELLAGATERMTLTLLAMHGLRVSGKVVDESGAPVPDATVRNERTASARTDAAGAFTIEEPEGRESSWALHVSADGFIDTDELVRFGADWVREGETVIVLHRPLPITGVVVDDLGAPVAEVQISGMQDGIVLPTGSDGKNATTDAAGHFTLSRTFAGEWELSLLPPDPRR